jgi:phospholipid/cholesterol/gamma-HCH transport system permease protein
MATGSPAQTPAQGRRSAGPLGRVVDWTADWIADLGQRVMEGVCGLGNILLFSFSTFRWLLTRPPRLETIWSNFYEIGVLSLPVVALTGTFIGMVMALQSYGQFHRLGMETGLGGVINVALLRELGPVLAATMLAGRVGSSMAAELGTMRVTEQIDALASMGANPIHYLVVPRFLGCLVLIPALTTMADFMGVVGGYYYSVFILQIDSHHYLQNAADSVVAFDLFAGIFKSLFFGGAIALIGCHHGFHCDPGAEGVGRAATSAFVYSFVVILLLDLMLGIGLEEVEQVFWPERLSFF